MALVRISKKLLFDVDKAIRSIEHKSLAATVTPFNPVVDPTYKSALVTAALDILWGEHAHLRTQIPEEWTTVVPRLDVTFIDDKGHNVYPEQQVVTEVACPPNSSRHGSYVEVRVPLSAMPSDFSARVAAFDATLVAHVDRFKNVRVQVAEFLKRSKSLNDAVKRYPDISLYINQEALDELGRTVDRKRGGGAAKEVCESGTTQLDMELISITGVIGKLQK